MCKVAGVVNQKLMAINVNLNVTMSARSGSMFWAFPWHPLEVNVTAAALPSGSDTFFAECFEHSPSSWRAKQD